MGPCSAFNGHTCCSYCVTDIQTVSLLGKLRYGWSLYGSLLEAFGVVVHMCMVYPGMELYISLLFATPLPLVVCGSIIEQKQMN